MEKEKSATFVVIGGGIAGVSCSQSLSFLCPSETIILITASPMVKTVTNIVPLSKMLVKFDVVEKGTEEFSASYPLLHILEDIVVSVSSDTQSVFTKTGLVIKYKMLCVCTGGYPKLIDSSPYTIGIRDTASVKEFESKIQNARRLVIVGNGGIATEIVHEIEGVEIIWVIKDKHISATFIDPGAAEFFQSQAHKSEAKKEKPQTTIKRLKYTVSEKCDENKLGAALGPDWHMNCRLSVGERKNTKVTMEYKCEVKNISSPERTNEWPVYVELTNGKIYGCDLIISATGVTPSIPQIHGANPVEMAEDGGIKVDWKMQTSVPGIFAAGDVCSASWDQAHHWFQMRLWTQARQMGMYAAKCMAASLAKDDVLQDFCFELFSHVTNFFGFKVVLLGLFNGQKLNDQYEILLRVTKGVEYVKLILKDGKMEGAVLIGETDLEEMCENLILNQLDLTPFGEDLLNPNIDIEDYFD